MAFIMAKKPRAYYFKAIPGKRLGSDGNESRKGEGNSWHSLVDQVGLWVGALTIKVSGHSRAHMGNAGNGCRSSCRV